MGHDQSPPTRQDIRAASAALDDQLARVDAAQRRVDDALAPSVRPRTETGPIAGDTTSVPFTIGTRVRFGLDREPGTIAAVVIARAAGLTYEEDGYLIEEPGPRVWEYDVQADSDRRLVSCQPRELELLPIDLDYAAQVLVDGDLRRAMSDAIARSLLGELTYRRAHLEQQAAEIERLRRIVSEVTALTRDTDGDDIHPDAEIPVGEIQRALSEPGGNQ